MDLSGFPFPGTPSWAHPASVHGCDSLWTPSAYPWPLLDKPQEWDELLLENKRKNNLTIFTGEKAKWDFRFFISCKKIFDRWLKNNEYREGNTSDITFVLEQAENMKLKGWRRLIQHDILLLYNNIAYMTFDSCVSEILMSSSSARNFQFIRKTISLGNSMAIICSTKVQLAPTVLVWFSNVLLPVGCVDVVLTQNLFFSQYE